MLVSYAGVQVHIFWVSCYLVFLYNVIAVQGMIYQCSFAPNVLPQIYGGCYVAVSTLVCFEKSNLEHVYSLFWLLSF